MSTSRSTGAFEQALLREGLQRDLVTFTHRCFQTVVPGERFASNWHLDAIAHKLDEVRRGTIRRLIIAMPPRSLKSVCVSVALPAFVLGHDPARKIICVSYSEGLAGKHADDCRRVMTSEWYQALFPDTRIARSTASEIVTTRRGVRLTTSVGGTLTGRGGNLIIVDDPIKAQDAMSEPAREEVKSWFSSTLLSRLDNKETDAIVVVMQRVHVDDLAGHLIAAGGWEVLTLPAIAEVDECVALGRGRVHHRRAGDALQPTRESAATLEALRAEIGSLAFSAQYQQAPVPAEGNLIRREWLRFYDDPPERRPGDVLLLSWDTAMKASETADYSVCTVWLIRDDAHLLLDLVRERLDFPDLKRRAIALYERWRAQITLVEDKGSGTSLLQELRALNLPAIAFQPSGDKVMRMHAQSVQFEAGSVYLPRVASWFDDLLSELLAFPAGRHDDQVDSISQALEWAAARRSLPVPRIRRL
ncbi:phage terminase large subunit [Methylobacterium mesophilicum]